MTEKKDDVKDVYLEIQKGSPVKPLKPWFQKETDNNITSRENALLRSKLTRTYLY